MLVAKRAGKQPMRQQGPCMRQSSTGVHGLILAYLIAGHHAGLPDYETDDAKGRALRTILQEDGDFLTEALAQPIPADILEGAPPQTPQ